MELRKVVSANKLLLATILAVLLGVAIGLGCRHLNPSPNTVLLVGFPGDIFLRMLKMLMVPLITSSIITGLANMNGKSTGKMGAMTILYYLSTTIIAITIGLVLVLTIKPGSRTSSHGNVADEDTDKPSLNSKDVILDLFRNLFPDNIIQATFEQTRTEYVKSDSSSSQTSNSTSSQTASNATSVWQPTSVFTSGMNTLGLLVYCIVFGVLLGKMGHRGKTMLKFFNILNEITMKMVHIVMWFSPIGIMFLIAGKLLSVADLEAAAQQLGLYLITYLSGLVIHSCFVLPILYFILTRKNPFRVSLAMLQAFMTAVGVNSSAATLPVTLRCVEEKLKVDKTISRFVLPIGATINMDGGALFMAVSPVYIAQLNNINLHFTEILTLTVSATLASVGAAAVAGADIIAVLIILSAVGLPTHDITTILAVDWFLGRMRCMVNISGDALAASLLDHFFIRKRKSEAELVNDNNAVLDTDDTHIVTKM